MRFIDNRFLNKPDDDWDRRAISAKEDVINNGGDVNSYRDVWADCKDILAEKNKLRYGNNHPDNNKPLLNMDNLQPSPKVRYVNNII